jgi:hypothetical protein
MIFVTSPGDQSRGKDYVDSAKKLHVAFRDIDDFSEQTYAS